MVHGLLWLIQKKGIGAPATNTKVNGKRVDFDVKVAICMLDGFELEIIQPMDDKSIYAEHLKSTEKV